MCSSTYIREDAHITCDIMVGLSVPTLNLPRLGFSYSCVLPRLWDPGELALHLMSLGSFLTDLEHLLPLDTHMQHICIT